MLAPDGDSAIATLTDGDFFGEFALLDSEPRSNTVVAREYCNLYSLGRESFNQVLDDFPEFAAEVRRIAEERRAASDAE